MLQSIHLLIKDWNSALSNNSSTDYGIIPYITNEYGWIDSQVVISDPKSEECTS